MKRDECPSCNRLVFPTPARPPWRPLRSPTARRASEDNRHVSCTSAIVPPIAPWNTVVSAVRTKVVQTENKQHAVTCVSGFLATVGLVFAHPSPSVCVSNLECSCCLSQRGFEGVSVETMSGVLHQYYLVHCMFITVHPDLGDLSMHLTNKLRRDRGRTIRAQRPRVLRSLFVR